MRMNGWMLVGGVMLSLPVGIGCNARSPVGLAVDASERVHAPESADDSPARHGTSAQATAPAVTPSPTVARPAITEDARVALHPTGDAIQQGSEVSKTMHDSGETPVETTGLPTDLLATQPLLESRQRPSGKSDQTIRRLYPDGRLFTLSDRQWRASPDGTPVSLKAEMQWRQTGLIGDVAAVEATIREAWPSLTASGAPQAVQDGTETIWTACLPDGSVHRFASRGPIPPGIRAIDVAIARASVKGGVPLDPIPAEP